jgi:hypothetical protein
MKSLRCQVRPTQAALLALRERLVPLDQKQG